LRCVQLVPRFVDRWTPPSLPESSLPAASNAMAWMSTWGGVTVENEAPPLVERTLLNPPNNTASGFVGLTPTQERYHP